MSETVHYKGYLKKVDLLSGEALEGQCKRLLGAEPLESYYSSYAEKLMDKNYKQYVIHEGTLYAAVINEVDLDFEVFTANKNNGVINFEIRYYNGGCSFDEAMAEALKNIQDI